MPSYGTRLMEVSSERRGNKMGEYAQYQGEQIKIGTCEEMYYLRADQAHLVTPERGSVDPVRDAEAIRFRFPFPNEDGIEPGQFEDYNRGMVLDGMEVPAELADNHYSVQFSASNGYLTSLPCPESGKMPDGVRIAKNGYGGAVEIVQQRKVGDDLVAICHCKGCGMAWRLATLEDAQPALDALEAMAAAAEWQGVLDARHHGPEYAEGPNAQAETNREVARRLKAGYATEALAR